MATRSLAERARGLASSSFSPAVTGLGDLPEVWSNVSSVAQKVLAHDAIVLTAVLPEGKHARVYASTSASGSDPWP